MRLAARAMVKDDIGEIQAQLKSWIADPQVDVIVSTGGTGLTGRDVTPEAMRPLFDKAIEGFQNRLAYDQLPDGRTFHHAKPRLCRPRQGHADLRAARFQRRLQGWLGPRDPLAARQPASPLQSGGADTPFHGGLDGGDLPHLDPRGRARMVDVGAKAVTSREALATGRVRMAAETLKKALSGDSRKGSVRAVAEIAGIMAAKRTAELIPLCHPVALTSVSIEIEADEAALVVTARVKTSGQTGVEMEALTAVSGRLPHHLRHAQGLRPRHGHRRYHPAGEERRSLRRLSRRP